MSRPISGDHAIEVANFVCVFDSPFSARAIQSLHALKETFKDKYPVFSTTNVVSIQMSHGDVAPSMKPEAEGVYLQRLKADSKQPAWAIKVERNSIIVSCYVYERWVGVAGKAIEDLAAIVGLVDDGRNPVNHLVLHVVDRFVGGTKQNYKINQVFNSRSRYLSRQAKEAGALWHVYQGWFESIQESDGRLLHNLNLSTHETPHGMLTTIDHNVRYNFTQLAAASDIADVEVTRSKFDILHEKNKKVLSDLLNKKQCRAVKLCE
ncbi:TIGR04255 family protein [Desulforhopalus singaporensis]|uniref:TIGR04255 family protein n=1 Tax=Desulforhopalus singaporensis TaxID=91360 RepID=A0A1H0RIS2_9BACT|nr:TIGR04255 family protein [Desulforhopalus singaporensis]SDP29335.1 TIGR04255 family protein [Desulforhopalus singaporensis]